VLLRRTAKGYTCSWYASIFPYFLIDSVEAKEQVFSVQIYVAVLMVTAGHYEAQVWDEQTRGYQPRGDLQVQITVDETFDNDHRIVNQRGSAKGRFTFSAADSGQHKLCFAPQGPSSAGWLSGGASIGAIKFTLDMAIGETSKIEATDKGKIDDIVQKVQDLNSRLQDIRREQVFQRVGYSPFNAI
jgi:p24 family protein alpha